MPYDINDINNDANYWLNRCADMLEVIDLNDYSAEQLSALALILESPRPLSGPLRGGGSPRVPRPTLTLVADEPETDLVS